MQNNVVVCKIFLEIISISYFLNISSPKTLWPELVERPQTLQYVELGKGTILEETVAVSDQWTRKFGVFITRVTRRTRCHRDRCYDLDPVLIEL